MNKDLERLLHLHYGIEVWQDPTLLISSMKEYNELEYKLNEKLDHYETLYEANEISKEKVRICEELLVSSSKEQEQQIKQLQEELSITQKAFAECSSSEMSCRESLPLARKKIDELYNEIQSLKEELEVRTHQFNTTFLLKKHLQNETQSLKSQLEESDRIKEKYRHDATHSQASATSSNAIILEENEKLQKVIDEINRFIDVTMSNEVYFTGIKTGLKSILSSLECDFPLGRQYCAEHRDKPEVQK